MERLRALIEGAYESRATITPDSASAELREAVETAVGMLDAGALRVAEKRGSEWHVNQWLKKAVLLSFRIAPNVPLAGGAGLALLRQGAAQIRGLETRRNSRPRARVSCRPPRCAAARSSPRTSS